MTDFRKQISLFCLATMLCTSGLAAATNTCFTETPDTVVIKGETYTAVFSKDNGTLTQMTVNGELLAVANGKQGLWHVRYGNKTEDDAITFNGRGQKYCSMKIDGGNLVFTYTSPMLAANIVITPRTNTLDFKATVTPFKNDIEEFAVPGRLVFAPNQIESVICHSAWPRNVGMALNARFFGDHSVDFPAWARGREYGDMVYKNLYGNPAIMVDDKHADVSLALGPAGAEWLGKELAAKLNDVKVKVSRPFRSGQAEVVIADSPNGVFFGASRWGGKGYFFRLGGEIGESNDALIRSIVSTTVARLMREKNVDGRHKIAIIKLKNGPAIGSGAHVSVAAWLQSLKTSCSTNIIEISDYRTLVQVMEDPAVAVIFNPYGEMCPMAGDWANAVKTFVKNGGAWFETEGYPFYYDLENNKYLSIGDNIPAAFADLFHLKFSNGQFGVYSVQPFDWKPWAGAENQAHIFTPSKFTIGGADDGGFLVRSFWFHIPQQTTWNSPTVRFLFAKNAIATAVKFAEDNHITRRLADKLPPSLFEKLKKSPLYKYNIWSAKEGIVSLPQLPAPALLHVSSFLRGGFDKQYPDHLPPKPAFGTEAEFKAMIDVIHQRGSLFMPYTNNTWWCDHPRGPTFVKCGEAPLVITRNGKPYHEVYGQCDGWIVSMWHPAVRAANKEIIRQFTQDFPSDVIFQDQSGSRGPLDDLNPASPGRSAYVEGIVSAVRSDAAMVPLSTEDMWWGLLDSEVISCGHSFGLMGPRGGTSWKFMKETYPPNTWNVFPLHQVIAHDKVIMTHHNLGTSVDTPQQLAWTLGLGYTMINQVDNHLPGKTLTNHEYVEWLRWTDRIQKSVMSRYVGIGLTSFSHCWGGAGINDDGMIKTAYGALTISANLGPSPLSDGDHLLVPYGFHASAPGLEAGSLAVIDGVKLDTESSFVLETCKTQSMVWVYAKPGEKAAFPLPVNSPNLRAKLTDGTELKISGRSRVGIIQLPEGKETYKKLWEVLLSQE